MGPEDLLDRRGPDLLAAGDDDLLHPAVHLEPPAGDEPPRVSGGQPPSRELRVGAVAVAAQQHRSAHEDLAGGAETAVADPELDALEGTTVVDDARPGLGRPVGGHHVDRHLAWRAPAAEQHRTVARGVEPAERGRDQGEKRRTRDGERLDLGGFRAGEHGTGGTGAKGAGHDRETADVGEWQACDPAVARGVHAEARRGGPRRCLDGGTGEHRTLRLAGGAARGHDEGVTWLGRPPPGKRGAAVLVEYPCGAQRGEERCAGVCGQPTVERQHRVARLPARAEGLDEPRAGRQVERHELRHGG